MPASLRFHTTQPVGFTVNEGAVPGTAMVGKSMLPKNVGPWHDGSLYRIAYAR